MKTIIIDDEEKARKTIANYLSLYCKNIEVIAQAESVQAGCDVILRHNPELVILDINMPDGTGFDLLKKIDPVNFKLIFITAYEEYAIKAFKFSALDYLLKPVNPQELIDAVEKARKSIDNESLEMKFKAFLTNYHNPSNTDKKIVLKTSESIHLIDIKNIIRCAADGNYTIFYTIDGKKIMVSKILKDYDEMLAEYGFIRPHHSHLVNMNYIQSFEKRDGGSIIMKDKSIVPVSSRRKDELLNLFEKL